MSPHVIPPVGSERVEVRTRADHGRRRSARGFTLVELVIVMTVIGILAVTLGPKFFTQNVFSQRGYADELASALRYAQKTAVSSGCPTLLTLTSTTYVVAQQAASGNSCNPSDTTWSTPVIAADGAPIQGSAPANTTASPTGTYQFDDQGRLTGNSSTTLIVGARTITIVPGTGFVQVQ
jgi:MSHA pilin protein MshC